MTFKFPFIILFLIISSSPLPVSAQSKPDSLRHEDAWFGQDKIKHFTVSAWIGTITTLQFQSENISRRDAVNSGIVLSLAAGIGKEIFDSTKPDNIFSYKDLVWDALGISFFVIVFNSE